MTLKVNIDWNMKHQKGYTQLWLSIIFATIFTSGLINLIIYFASLSKSNWRFLFFPLYLWMAIILTEKVHNSKIFGKRKLRPIFQLKR